MPTLEVVHNNQTVARLPANNDNDECVVPVDLTTFMVLTAILPFIIVTGMHVGYALSCPHGYSKPVVQAGMITLNVLCALPYISWPAFVGLFTWLVICLLRRRKVGCGTIMRTQNRAIRGDHVVNKMKAGGDKSSLNEVTLSSLLDESSQFMSMTATSLEPSQMDSLSESSLGDFTAQWRSPI